MKSNTFQDSNFHRFPLDGNGYDYCNENRAFPNVIINLNVCRCENVVGTVVES